MSWRRVLQGEEDVRGHLRSAFAADHPPHLIGLSFALGLFLIALPNLGASLAVVAAIGYRFEWADGRALSAAAVVLNPLVKGGVYVASFAVGTLLLGPVPGVFTGHLRPSIGVDVLVRLLLGNTLIAAAAGGVGYVVARYGVRAVRKHQR